MTAVELKEIFVSPEFQRDLEELSSYLSSVMQERAIVYLLAKHIWTQRRYKFQLEAKHKDLVVDNKHIEFKFNWDRFGKFLEREMAKHGDWKEMRASVEKRTKRSGWAILHRICKDLMHKTPDMFVWIICSRDLSRVAPDDLQRVCVGPAQRKYHTKHPFNVDRSSLAIADGLLGQLRIECGFDVLEAEVATCGDFPSIYHFRICEFSKANGKPMRARRSEIRA